MRQPESYGTLIYVAFDLIARQQARRLFRVQQATTIACLPNRVAEAQAQRAMQVRIKRVRDGWTAQGHAHSAAPPTNREFDEKLQKSPFRI